MSELTDTAPKFKKKFVRHGAFTYHPLQVKNRINLTPRYVRITLEGPNVRKLYFMSPDDDVRVAIPINLDDVPGDLQVKYDPEYTVIYPDDAPPYEVKAYTIRRYDTDANELDLEIILHDKGHGDFWARNASPGQTVLVGGAWGSYTYDGQMDHLVLIGDETALPAISHLIEKQTMAPAVTLVAEVRDEAEQLTFNPADGTNLTVHWVYRGDLTPGKNDVLLNGVREHISHVENALYWGNGESATMRDIRRVLVEEKGVHRKALQLGGYWKREDDPEDWFFERDADQT